MNAGSGDERRAVRVGLVGVRAHGRTIFDAARRCGALEVVALCDHDAQAAAEAGERFGLDVCGFEELLDDERIEALLIVTPNHVHEEQCIAALDAGRHVFVEKPLALDARASARIARRAQETGLVVQVGHNARFADAVAVVQSLIEEGVLGTLVSVDAQFSHDAALFHPVAPWKLDAAQCPLLPMTQLGIHLVDTLRVLCGEITAVQCIAAERMLRGADGRTVHDVTCALVRFAGGVVGSIHASYIVPDLLAFRICGHRGHVHGTPEHVDLVARTGETRRTQQYPVEGGFAASFRDELRAFADAVRGRAPVAVDAIEGLINVAVVDAMQRAAATRCEVRVGDVLADLGVLLPRDARIDALLTSGG